MSSASTAASCARRDLPIVLRRFRRRIARQLQVQIGVAGLGSFQVGIKIRQRRLQAR